jgi:N-acetylglucosaminyldiphosphoundecaprenol N-acetyl-beta-D-mannosaminyltransferase
VSAINLPQAVDILLGAIGSGKRGYVCVTGVHGVSEAQADPEFRAILNAAFLNTPDGMPMSWVGRLQGHRTMDRVYGPDLMRDLSAAGVARGAKHFYYGGKEGVAEELKRKMEEKFPGIQIVGTYTPPFRPLNESEEKELIERIAILKPDFFWVGLSTPKQERFMAQYWQKLDAKIFFGVGAAFDMHAGQVQQAPFWMQRSGLEWLFRLIVEPRRLWKRYMINNPLFLGRIALQFSGLRKYDIANPSIQ